MSETRPRVFIVCPAYKNLVASYTQTTVVDIAAWLSARGMFAGHVTFSQFDIVAVRNYWTTFWYDKTDATHLLFVDDDMHAGAEHVADMLRFGRPLSGAIYPKKGGESFVGSFAATQNAVDGFLPMRGIGAGLMLIRRDVVTAILDKGNAAIEPARAEDQFARNLGIRRVLHLFDPTASEHGNLSEDLSFCHRYREAGGEVWGLASRPIGHVGMHEWKGAFLPPAPAAMKPDGIADLIGASRLTAIVDVGAAPIDGDPIYRDMLDAGLCRITGFEPDPVGYKALVASAGPYETYLNTALGDGNAHTFHSYLAPGLNGLLAPGAGMAALPRFDINGRVVATREILTSRLDAVLADEPVDFIKIDAQGAELMILEGAGKVLDEVVAVQMEVSFLPLYAKQPGLGEIDGFMRAKGFVPHGFRAIKTWPLTDIIRDGASTTQLLEADVIYVRNFLEAQSMDAEKWKHLALLAHYALGSKDLAHLALGKVSPVLAKKYADEAVDGAREAA